MSEEAKIRFSNRSVGSLKKDNTPSNRKADSKVNPKPSQEAAEVTKPDLSLNLSEEKIFCSGDISEEAFRQNDDLLEDVEKEIKSLEKLLQELNASSLDAVDGDEPVSIKPLDELLKDIDTDELEVDKSFIPPPDFPFEGLDPEIKEKILSKPIVAKTLTKEERERLKQLLFSEEEGDTIEEDGATGQHLQAAKSSSDQLDPSQEAAKGKCSDFGGPMWSWLAPAERARIKEIDDELSKLKEVHHADMSDSELERLLRECQEQCDMNDNLSDLEREATAAVDNDDLKNFLLKLESESILDDRTLAASTNLQIKLNSRNTAGKEKEGDPEFDGKDSFLKGPL